VKPRDELFRKGEHTAMLGARFMETEKQLKKKESEE